MKKKTLALLEETIKEKDNELKEYRYILDTQREREYYSKFLKDFQKERGKNVYPDHDEIYKRYDKYKSIIETLEKWLNEEYEVTVFDYHFAIEDVLNKLQELKDSDKE